MPRRAKQVCQFCCIRNKKYQRSETARIVFSVCKYLTNYGSQKSVLRQTPLGQRDISSRYVIYIYIYIYVCSFTIARWKTLSKLFRWNMIQLNKKMVRTAGAKLHSDATAYYTVFFWQLITQICGRPPEAGVPKFLLYNVSMHIRWECNNFRPWLNKS